jgi:acetyl esterase/lipase
VPNVPFNKVKPMNHPWHSACWIAVILLTNIARESFAQEKTISPMVGYRQVEDLSYIDPDDRPTSDYRAARCMLDLYVLTGAKDFSTVVWFHGGGLTKGNKSIPDGLKGKGIAIIAPNYRLSPQATSPAFIEDAAAAVAWAFQNIEQYGGSPKRIFVSGHSAGGYLTSMIGLEKKWLAHHQVDADDIAGLIPISGQAITHFTIRKERGINEKQPLVDNMAPLFHVRPEASPILLISGDRELEMVGRYEEQAYLWRMLKVVGHQNVELLELQGYDHGGVAEPAFPLLVQFINRNSP